MKTVTFNVTTRVSVNGLSGVIYRIRYDDLGDAIFTVLLDDSSATPYGLYCARAGELVAL